MSSAEPAVGQNTDSNTETPNVGGRPLKFESVEALQQKIDAYFAECDPHPKEVDAWVYPLDKDGKPDTKAEQVIGKVRIITEAEPYTITGLALALDTTRETLLDYGDGKYDKKPGDPNYDPLGATFSDTIKKAKLRCQQYAERYLYTGKNTAGAIFNLKNNHGWVDKQIEEGTQEIVITTRKHKSDGGR